MKKLLKAWNIERFHTNELTKDEIKELTDKYNLHDIIIEDMQEISTQDKVDVYDDCLFLVLHFPKFENKRYTMNEFDCILGNDYIVTITKYKTSIIESIKQEYSQELQADKEQWHEALYKTSPYYILYRIIDAMYDKTLHGIKQFQYDMIQTEAKIFDKYGDSSSVEEIMQKRRNMVILRHMMNPQTAIVTELQKETEKIFDGQLEVYFEDLSYKTDKIHSYITILQEDIDSLYDAANTLTNIRINRTMKIFTIFTAIIGVMTLISGMYGMNVKLPGDTHPYMFFIILSIMMLIIACLLKFFVGKWRLK